MKRSVYLSLVLSVLCLTQANAAELPEQYKPFQGRWKQTPPPDSTDPNTAVPEVFVDVVGRSFVLHGDGVAKNCRRVYEYRVPGDREPKPYQYLHDRGTRNVADLVDLPNQITVFWWVGIYRFADDRIELALKYCGQGVEGDAARMFRPPSAFKANPPKGVARIFLQRVPVDDAELLTESPDNG
ncbi:hypothetical protein [Rhodopirellula europaea]|uniref:hypothetical protein n=1 Tax=Rhodopirellula europaea TaxID=1263866 RepID=UPI003D295561